MNKGEIDELEKLAFELDQDREAHLNDPNAEYFQFIGQEIKKLIAHVRRLEKVREAAIFYNDHVAIGLAGGKSATIESALKACEEAEGE